MCDSDGKRRRSSSGFDHLARVSHVDEASVEGVVKPAVPATVIGAGALVAAQPSHRNHSQLGGFSAAGDAGDVIDANLVYHALEVLAVEAVATDLERIR